MERGFARPGADLGADPGADFIFEIRGIVRRLEVRKEAPSATAGPAGPPRRVRRPVAYADRSWNRWMKDLPPDDPLFRPAADPSSLSNRRRGPARAAPAVIIDWGKPYDEKFPGMDPGELDAAICDDACFPGDLGFGGRVTSGRFS